jgi:leader peptidase (prepilin peptidase)/N-methyltransferase
MVEILIFIIGIIIGSFLNVCICRIPEKKSIAFPASHCTKCGTGLKAADLIPIISYLLLKGKCRYCKAQISVQYPIVELISGLIILLLFYKYTLSLLFVKYAIVAYTLLVIAVIDFNTQEIPDGLLIFGIVACLFFISVDKDISIISALIGAAVGFGIFLIIALISNAMGGGDIKLMAFLGLAVGWKNILMVSLFSFVIGAVISLLLIIFKLKSRKDYIPFAPFIFCAFMLVVLWGEKLLDLYMKSI